MIKNQISNGSSDKFNDDWIIGVARIFDWGGGPNHKSHAMTSSEIFKKGAVFVGQRYRRMEDLKPSPVGT